MVLRSVLILPVLIGVMVLLSEPPKGRGEWFESIRCALIVAGIFDGLIIAAWWVVSGNLRFW